jgi:hypothetical protein
MGWASQSGRAVCNPESPRAYAKCDGCQFLYNHHKLKWQREWAGTQIINKGFLVCDICRDVPNIQLKARLMPPDPVPIANPRPETYRYPINVRDVGVQTVHVQPLRPTVPPPPRKGPLGTERDPERNYPAGVPLEIEP